MMMRIMIVLQPNAEHIPPPRSNYSVPLNGIAAGYQSFSAPFIHPPLFPSLFIRHFFQKIDFVPKHVNNVLWMFTL